MKKISPLNVKSKGVSKPQNPAKPKLNAGQLRRIADDDGSTLMKASARNPLFFILDNIYDTYNIGGLFRLADALHISELYICGDSETPPNHKVIKASIGTYKIVPWRYFATTADCIAFLRTEYPTIHIAAIEQSPTSTTLFSTTATNFPAPLALIAGNETHGISPETIALTDSTLELPMFGTNISLNVIVATAITAYHAIVKNPALTSAT